jgi:tetratricopeptide (TPR) repeat protein
VSNEESMKAGDALDHDGDEREGTAARAASKASPAKAADDEAGEEREDDAQAEGEGSDAVDGEAAGRVARALGVGDEAEGEGANAEGEAAEAEAAPTNRAARRREEALKRRRKKAAGAPADSDEELPRDKNARAKERLLRRREQAAEREAAVTSGLLPGEMVDDALARMTSASMKWLRRNLGAIQWVALAAILATAGGLTWNWRSEKKSGAASSELASAIADEHGRVMPEDKRTDEEKEYDFARVFKTPEERSDAALAAYEKVAAQEPGSGASILAKLGIAGVELEKRDYAKALDAYAVVLSSKLAAADADVKARALEGTGFAKEGKGDLDGALASFKELQGIDAKGFKELGMYHEARVLVAKGDKAKAEQLLKAVRDKLQAPTPDGSKPFRFLEATVDRKLLELDPTAVPRAATPAPGGGAQLTPEQIELLKKQFQKAAQDAAKQKQQQGGQ